MGRSLLISWRTVSVFTACFLAGISQRQTIGVLVGQLCAVLVITDCLFV